VLHTFVSEVGGQGAPPLEGCVRMVRVRVAKPPPQVAEHAPRIQSETAQFTAVRHACALHATVSESGGQAVPPLDAAVRIVRVLVAKPPPHVTEHVPVVQSETTQFTGGGAAAGHDIVLHETVPVIAGQGVPPLDAAVRIVRV